MADNVGAGHVLAVLPAFRDWWHGDEGDDTPYAICGAVLDALLALPVEQRMAVMGMVAGECRWCGMDPDVAKDMTGECIDGDDAHLFMWREAKP